MITTRRVLMAAAILAFLGSPVAGQVASSPNDIQPVGTGDKIPAATVRTVAGEDFDLAAAATAKPTVLIFYRGGW